jgi:hypothetical protein
MAGLTAQSTYIGIMPNTERKVSFLIYVSQINVDGTCSAFGDTEPEFLEGQK